MIGLVKSCFDGDRSDLAVSVEIVHWFCVKRSVDRFEFPSLNSFLQTDAEIQDRRKAVMLTIIENSSSSGLFNILFSIRNIL